MFDDCDCDDRHELKHVCPIKVTQGATRQITVTISSVDTGKPINVDAPLQIWATVRAYLEDTAAMLLKRTTNAGGNVGEISPIDPQVDGGGNPTSNIGQAIITFGPVDTSQLVYGHPSYWLDVWTVDALGNIQPAAKRRKMIVTDQLPTTMIGGAPL